MAPLDREIAQRRGQRKADALRRRTGQLRKRVVATAAVAFVLLWTAVFVQMATGNDPGLGAKASARSAVQEKRAQVRKRGRVEAAAPPPEAVTVEEQAEAERLEFEEREAEARELEEIRELEELEAVSTGQS